MFILDGPGEDNEPKFIFNFDYSQPDLVNKLLQTVLWPVGGEFLPKLVEVTGISLTFATAKVDDLKDWKDNIFPDWKGSNNIPMGLTLKVKSAFSKSNDYEAIKWLRSIAPKDLYVYSPHFLSLPLLIATTLNR